MCFKPTIHEPFVAVAKPTGRSSKIQLGGIDDRLIGTFRKLVSGPKLETGKRDVNKKEGDVKNGADKIEGEGDKNIGNLVVTCSKCVMDKNNNQVKVPKGYRIYYDASKNDAPMFILDETETVPDNCLVNGKHVELTGYSNTANNVWIKDNTTIINNGVTSVGNTERGNKGVISDTQITTHNTIENVETKQSDTQNSSNKQGKIDIEYKPTTTATPTEKESESVPIREEYKDLVLTDVQIKELDSVFKLNVIIEEPKSEMVYEEYLKAYSTPLLGMVETKTQETLESDIVVTGNLNIFLIFTSETENNVSDELIDSTISSLQKAVDEVFAKLYGYNNFPNKIKVNIFEIAYTTTITLTTNKTAIRNTKYKDEDHLANILEVCHYSTKPKCTSTHHLVIIYDVSATKNTVFDHEVTHATVAVSSDSNHYKKIVFSMTGALYLCDLPNISLKDEDAAFVKATCSADIEGNLQLTDMDAAYLRRIWDIQTKPITAVPDTLPVSQLET